MTHGDYMVKYALRIQDPTVPRSTLLDVIVEIAKAGNVKAIRLFFGFLTGSGLKALLAAPDVANMLRNAKVSVLVGVDAVTDREGLEGLRELERDNARFRARAIKNPTAALVHPKMLFAQYADRRSVAIIGSNNLSLGGLTDNVEGYALAYFDSGEDPDLSDWRAFLFRWRRAISRIDDQVLASADRNAARLGHLRHAARTPDRLPATEVVISDGQAYETPEATPIPADLDEPILVSTVPRAGSRWSQVHISADICRTFFKVDPAHHPTLELRELHTPTVEARQIVYSTASNKNVRIEVGVARTLPYPAIGRPLVLFRREGTSRFRYLLVMPGDAGHPEMTNLLARAFTPSHNQLPRVVTGRSHVLHYWPACPL